MLLAFPDQLASMLEIYAEKNRRELRQKTFLVSSVRLFAYRLFDMDGYYFCNVRPEQTECAKIVRTRDTEMADVLVPDGSFAIPYI